MMMMMNATMIMFNVMMMMSRVSIGQDFTYIVMFGVHCYDQIVWINPGSSLAAWRAVPAPVKAVYNVGQRVA